MVATLSVEAGRRRCFFRREPGLQASVRFQSLSGYKAILFDFGGTLDSDGEHWLDRFYELYERAGLNIPREEIKRVFYLADAECCADPQVNELGLRALMKHHIRLQFAGLNLKNAETERELAEKFCSRTESFLERNQQLLRRLKHAYKLGVVSNFYGNVDVLCREAGLAESLDAILDSTKLGISKPSPEIFRIALGKLGVAPQDAVFVGDSYERDMLPSRHLGMKTVWLKGPNPRLPENPEPVDCIISSLSELEPVPQ